MKTPGRLEGIHVLVVEDNPDALEITACVLEHHGATVTTAISATHAADILARVVPDVVLTDVAMPGQDGLWLVRTVRANARTRHLPVIALTARAMPAERRAGMAAGFDAYIAKPAELHTICETVRRFAQRDRKSAC